MSLSGKLPTTSYQYNSLMNKAIDSSARSAQYMPINGSSFSNATNNLIRIELRASASEFWDSKNSYLKFKVTFNATNSGILDGSAASFFSRVRVLCGSTVISDLNSFGVVMNNLIANGGSDDLYRTMSITSGVDSRANIEYDYNIGASKGGAVFESTGVTTRTFSIPLIGGVFASPRLIPLCMMAPVTIELTMTPTFSDVWKRVFTDNASGTAYTGTLTHSISGVALVSRMVTINDQNALQQIKDMMIAQDGLRIKTTDYTCIYNTVQAQAGNQYFPIATRSKSLKSIISMMVNTNSTTTISNIQTYPNNIGGDSTVANVEGGYSYKVGSVQYPNQDVAVAYNNLTESYSEYLRCFASGLWNLNAHSFSDYYSWYPTYTATPYAGRVDTANANIASGNGTVGNAITTGISYGSFAMAYNFEAYNFDELFSGIDTETTAIPVSLKINFAQAPASCTLISLCISDQVLIVKPDGNVLVDL